MKLKSLFALSAAALLFVACGDEPDPIVDTPPVTDSVETDVEPEIQTEFLPPSPIHIAMMFKEYGLSYVDGVIHDPAMATNYSTDNSKMLNLGVYSADVAYMIINEETSASMDHMEAIRNLSGELDLNTLFDSDVLIDRFQANLDNRDSLINIITSIQEDLDEYVDENDETHLRLMVFAGAWGESMYLGSQAVLEEGSDNQLGRRLVEQMTILESMLKAMHSSDESDPLFIKVRTEMQEAHDLFRGFESVKQYEENIDFETLQLNSEEISSLAQKMQQLRSTIVEG